MIWMTSRAVDPRSSASRSSSMMSNRPSSLYSSRRPPMVVSPMMTPFSFMNGYEASYRVKVFSTCGISPTLCSCWFGGFSSPRPPPFMMSRFAPAGYVLPGTTLIRIS